ncbi:hypothetical protein I310_04331 [Cryptococcus deuterogattii CA1014]|nr:hypothetical protein I310_04331 [Cryptococcus deuterogattii CA1014]
MASRERILSDDLINYITSTAAVAQVLSQLKAPEELEHASLKGGIALDDTWGALPELFNAGLLPSARRGLATPFIPVPQRGKPQFLQHFRAPPRKAWHRFGQMFR